MKEDISAISFLDIYLSTIDVDIALNYIFLGVGNVRVCAVALLFIGRFGIFINTFSSLFIAGYKMKFSGWNLIERTRIVREGLQKGSWPSYC